MSSARLEQHLEELKDHRGLVTFGSTNDTTEQGRGENEILA